MNINSIYVDTFQYKSINKKSKQYKAAASDCLGAIIDAENAMDPIKKQIYEMLGGREANMKAHMEMYDSDGNKLNANGVAGMSMDGVSLEEAHQIIDVSEEWRQKMFDETKRHFIQENGVSNGDTTKRSEIFTAYQKSTPIKDRLRGTWTLGQYEQQYKLALYKAVKTANPDWELGQPFDTSILDSVTREAVDNSLEVGSGTYGQVFSNTGIDYTV
jgi:hypothetical protein